jgi:glycosyltransferase involved in cell wall biosynthesis
VKIAYIVLKGMPLGGGIEKYTDEIGSRLAARGHEIIVYTMKHYGATAGVYQDMKIRTVPSIRRRGIEKMSAAFMATIRNSFENGTDIVHYHAYGPAIFSVIPRLLGKKTVVQGHGLEWKRSRWGWGGRLFLRLSERPSVKFPHRITVVSKVQQAYLKHKYGVESTYIPTGVNPPQREAPNLIKKYGLNGDDYVLFAARLVKEKGAHYLVRAYNKLNTDLKLVISGDAVHEDEYKSRLYKLSQGTGKIVFTGFVTGKLLNELFSNAYLFVLPSEIEGLPTVLLEAMSYGNCCLVSDVPENLEALNRFGYAFRNKDVDDLKDKLTFLMNNRSAVEQFKKDAGDYVIRNYCWDDIATLFEKFYEDVLNIDNLTANRV